MVVVFASFVLSTDPAVKMLSVGMAVAVLIDASLVRMILVPSIMSLLGKTAWWMPRWLEPVVPHLHLEGSAAAEEAAAADAAGAVEPSGTAAATAARPAPGTAAADRPRPPGQSGGRGDS